MRYSISNAIPHNPKSKKHPYENLVKQGLSGFALCRRDEAEAFGRHITLNVIIKLAGVDIVDKFGFVRIGCIIKDALQAVLDCPDLSYRQ